MLSLASDIKLEGHVTAHAQCDDARYGCADA